jgi:hypothetical protein
VREWLQVVKDDMELRRTNDGRTDDCYFVNVGPEKVGAVHCLASGLHGSFLTGKLIGGGAPPIVKTALPLLHVV